MKVSYNWLTSYFDKGLPPAEKLAELFNAHAFEVEGIEENGGDSILDLKVLPDRSHYALSHRGVAYEASAITGAPIKAVENESVSIDSSIEQVGVDVREPRLCSRYMARKIDGVRISESPEWLAQRLVSIGTRSINSAVDAANFIMFDIGQPLHAFDAAKVKGSIVVRMAVSGEKIEVLDGREIELVETDLVIADDEGPIAIAGVKGGKRAEVTSSTSSIIVEAANFDPVCVRRTSTRAGLRNDSSKRFENGITPDLAEEAIERLTSLVRSFSPDSKAGSVTDIYAVPAEKWNIEVDPAHMNSVTGLSLSEKEMADILSRLRCEVETAQGRLIVTPPLDRLDLRIPEDIADEIGRLHGYEGLESKLTPSVPEGPVDDAFLWSERIRDILAGQGFSEAILYSLVRKGAFEVAYPLASDKSALREKLSPKLAEALSYNSHNADLLGLEAIKIFEIGNVFPKAGEKAALAIGALQVKKRKGVTSESIVREALVALENTLRARIDAKIETAAHGAIAEVDLDVFVKALGKYSGPLDFASGARMDAKYVPFSHYPFIVRDIAFFTPAGVTLGDAMSVVSAAAKTAAAGLLAKGPDAFDIFEKDGKISYGFRMIFQSHERTLSDDEVNEAMRSVYSAVQEKGWETR